jgi:hypothetical protein
LIPINSVNVQPMAKDNTQPFNCDVIWQESGETEIKNFWAQKRKLEGKLRRILKYVQKKELESSLQCQRAVLWFRATLRLATVIKLRWIRAKNNWNFIAQYQWHTSWLWSRTACSLRGIWAKLHLKR